MAHGSRLTAQGKSEQSPVLLELERKRHETIQQVTEDIEHLHLNTAISAMMIFSNVLHDALQPSTLNLEPRTIQPAFETLILLLSPFAPHLAEELWQRLGHPQSLAQEPWPSFDQAVLTQAEILWVVQVNGKVRARITLPVEATEERLRQVVLADDRIKKFVNGQPIKQFIVVPKRLVNIVV